MKKLLIIIYLSTLGLNLKSVAQNTLTLNDAIIIGLEQNFDIQIENEKVNAASINNTWGQAGRLPTIDLQVNESNSFSSTDNPARLQNGDFFNVNVGPQLTANWTIFEGFKVNITKHRLELLEEQSSGNSTIIVENTIQGIVQAYYSALLEQERLNTLKETMKLSRMKYRYSEAKLELGSAVTYDVLRDKNNYLTDSSNYLNQELKYRNALRQLNVLLAEDVQEEFVLIDKLSASEKDYAFADLHSRMTKDNSTLKNQFINLKILQEDVKLAKTALMPRLGVTAGASYEKSYFADISESKPENQPTVDIGTTKNYYMNFSLAYRLWDGGKIKRSIQNAQIQERIGNLQIDKMENELSNLLLSNLELYNVQKNVLKVRDENLKTADLNLELATEKFRNGTITTFEFRDVQINQLRASLEKLQSIYELINTDTELMRISGGILTELNP
ncbi:TolC family protein [Aureibacter tunicatorum]|uniref:Outer membrane protein TolC n=1 Tax=Aureibacter tunicatorum TaxID=866807 RepID=A0AAE4BS34_9BACT|nr:TolC family protein [Aureibacter tunicatorum]MDR6239336.1 outer membrane protein TolC [Aureibacter tunicatorum]BDD04741.1 membrane protein [Aureibacter tunicatorum]